MSQSPPFPPDLVNQLRIFAALAQFRLRYDRGLSKHPGTSVPSVPMPISFANIPANLNLPLYWVGVEDSPVPPNEGIVAGEIIGHRCWRVGRGALWSMCLDYPWAPHQVIEGDIKRYGVHSFKQRRQVLNYAAGTADTIVIGTVKMWGEVIEHERGYRAQYARVNSLDEIIYQSRCGIAGQDMVHGYFTEVKRRGTHDDEQLLRLREIYGCG